jgi:cyclopropane fatty-acyl-phospholipid synthase-like methyltransferase
LNTHDFKGYDFENPTTLFILEDKLKGLLGGPLLYNPYFKTFGLKGNERVLDFGCGGGAGSRCLANLLNKDGHLICVDLSGYWIAKARKRLEKYSNVECKSGDIRELDIPDSLFDVISAIHVVHDIAPAERQDTVKTLSQKLKAGGLFFIKEPVKKSHGMLVEEIRTLMSDAGLNEIEHKETKSEYIGKYQKTG